MCIYRKFFRRWFLFNVCICEPSSDRVFHPSSLRFFRCGHFCNSFLFSCLFVRIYLSSPNRQPFAIVRHCWRYVCIAESEFLLLYDTRKVIRTRKGPLASSNRSSRLRKSKSWCNRDPISVQIPLTSNFIFESLTAGEMSRTRKLINTINLQQWKEFILQLQLNLYSCLYTHVCAQYTLF